LTGALSAVKFTGRRVAASACQRETTANAGGTRVARTDILNVITPDQAVSVLKELAATDPEIRKKARAIARKLVSDVDVEEIAEEVFCELDSIAVEQVWDRSGSKRDGYVDSGDAAWQLFEEALTPFLDSLRRCQRLGLTAQAMHHGMGILKGIYRFEKESDSEFKSWAVDAPGEYFASTYREWRKGTTSRQEVAAVRRFVKTFCPPRAAFCK
jgi:hypothetical protein